MMSVIHASAKGIVREGAEDKDRGQLFCDGLDASE